MALGPPGASTWRAPGGPAGPAPTMRTDQPGLAAAAKDSGPEADTKTRLSKRTLAIPDLAVAAFRRRQQQQDEERAATRATTPSNACDATNARNEHQQPTTARRVP